MTSYTLAIYKETLTIHEHNCSVSRCSDCDLQSIDCLCLSTLRLGSYLFDNLFYGHSYHIKPTMTPSSLPLFDGFFEMATLSSLLLSLLGPIDCMDLAC